MKYTSTLISRALFLLFLTVFCMTTQVQQGYAQTAPLRVGVIGLTHSHVHWILGRPDRGDIEIVGIVESNAELAQRYADQYGYPMDMVYTSMQEMIDITHPEAVTAFGSIYDHLKVVETCAPLGIHVMVEKPLAVSLEHAKTMKALAEKHGIQLLTNYETTWYASNHKAFEMMQKNKIGALRKIVVHDGHPGPVEIGVNDEFLEWLTDPVLNGAGALTDFGCYGANLITWLKNGQRPDAVMAVTQTIKPDVYPKVDDEATIILVYPDMQGIIQASWNWPVSRKDMEIYGKTGYIYTDNRSDLRFRLSEKESEQKEKLPENPSPYDDPFAYFTAVIRDEISIQPYDLSSLENNMIVMEILDAAKKSAKTGSIVILSK